MRDEGPHLAAALDEAVTIARTAGARLQVSHCKAAGRTAHGGGPMLLERLAAARLEGVDAQGDQYPYDAGATVLSTLLPPAVAAGGTEAMRARLRDPAARAALRAQAERGGIGDGSWAEADPADVLLTGHTRPGRGRPDAGRRGRRPRPLGRPLRAGRRRPGGGHRHPPDARGRRAGHLASPLVGIGSDNGPPAGLQHPRTWGCFPRLLGRYVREEQVLTWEQADPQGHLAGGPPVPAGRPRPAGRGGGGRPVRVRPGHRRPRTAPTSTPTSPPPGSSTWSWPATWWSSTASSPAAAPAGCSGAPAGATRPMTGPGTGPSRVPAHDPRRTGAATATATGSGASGCGPSG